MGPKELVGWVGTVTDSRSYTPPTPRFTDFFKHMFFTTSEYCVQNLFTTRCFLEEQSVHGHVAALKISLTRKIGKHVLSHFKTRAFRDQTLENTCLENRFCTGSGRRTPALKFCQNSYGFVCPPVVSSVENHKEDRGLGRLVEFVTETPYSSRFICIPYSSRFMNNYFICS